MATDRQIAQLIKELEKRLGDKAAQAFAEAIASIKNRADAAAIDAAIQRGFETGDIEGAARQIMETLRMDGAAFSDLDRALEDAFRAGGDFEMKQNQPPKYINAPVFRFDVRHPEAERYVRQAGARLVVQIEQTTREAVRDTLGAGMEQGRGYAQVRRDLVGTMRGNQREGGVVGLHSQFAGYVNNAREELETLSESYFSRKRRNRRFDEDIRAAFDAGRPVPAKILREAVNAYSDRLLITRGNTIARSESNQALAIGRRQAFEQMIEREGVPAEAISVRWDASVDKRTRDSHLALNGQVRPWGMLFISPITGAAMMHPHDPDAPAAETVNCRCGVTRKVNWSMMAR